MEVSYFDLVASGTVKPCGHYKLANSHFKNYVNRAAEFATGNAYANILEMGDQILSNDGKSFEHSIVFSKPFTFTKSNGEKVVYTDKAHCKRVIAKVNVFFDKDTKDEITIDWGKAKELPKF